MEILFVYSVVLLAAVLVSSYAERSLLSTSVLFLFAGFLCGPGVLGMIKVNVDDPVVDELAEFALVAVLFTDGMRLNARELVSTWRLPGRALLLGLPITFLLNSLLAAWLLGFGATDSLLIGAALCPTDPVFASAIVGRSEVPRRLRRLLNIESGLNDGLALPVVLILLAMMRGDEVRPFAIAAEVVGGIAIGLVIPWLALWLEESRFFSSIPEYRPLNAIAIGLTVYSAASLCHANAFLAVFAAGILVANRSPEVCEAFHGFGELAVDALKFAALLIFGAIVTPTVFAQTTYSGALYIALLLIVVRPVSLLIAMAGSQLSWKEWAVAAWFGPKGFASVVYGLLILKSSGSAGAPIFQVIAITCFASIILHSSTDVAAVHWIEPRDAVEDTPDSPPPE